MREIKFRGQTRRKGEYLLNMAGDKCDSNWVYGGIFPQNEYEKGFAVIYQQKTEIKKYPVYADTVGQYIGKTDINKNEIYEGDVVKTNSGRLCKIVWFSSPQYQGWDLVPIETKNPAPEEWGIWEDLEVVGNIFDNPELLKGDDEE